MLIYSYIIIDFHWLYLSSASSFLVPSMPLNVACRSVGYRSILVTWEPPHKPNGIINHYTAMHSLQGSESQLTNRIACYFEVPRNATFLPAQLSCVYYGDIDMDSQYFITVGACTNTNEQGQGGGCGEASIPVLVKTWSGSNIFAGFFHLTSSLTNQCGFIL